MSVHRDEAMHTTADDGEFAALMAVSSLGASHVRTLGTAIPDEARRRLHAAAARPDAAGDSSSRDADGHPAVPKDAGEAPQEHASHENTRHLPAPGTVAEMLADTAGTDRAPVPRLWRLPHADGNSRLPGRTAAAPGGRSLAARLLTAYLNPPQPRSIAVRLALDVLRAYADSRAIEHLRKPQATDPGSTALVIAAGLWLVSNGRARGGRTAAHTAAERLGIWPATPAMGGDLTPGCSPVPADPAPITGDPAFAVIVNGCEPGPSTAAAARNTLGPCLSAGGRHEHPGCSAAWHWLLAKPFTDQEARTFSSAVAEADASPSRAEKSRHGRLSAACLTDLLHLAPPAPWDHVCPRLLRTGRTAGVWEIGAAYHIMSELVCRACPTATGTHPAHRKANPVVEMLPHVSDQAAHPVFSPTHLLVAAELAVDLAPAHPRAIPAQPPPLPDMAAYETQPTSTLLLPAASTGRPARSGGRPAATDGAVDVLPKTARPLQTSACSRADSGLLLRSDQGGDGPEQHARLWLRLHQTEDDDGKRLPVRLIYRAADRYAITAVFNAGTDEETEWIFARELLVDGLHHSVGIGDVIVWPGPDGPHHADNRRRIFIRLRSPEGTALLSMAREDAVAFLEAGEPLAEGATRAASADSLSEWENELTKLLCPRSGE